MADSTNSTKHRTQSGANDTKFGQTVLDDLNRTDLRQSLGRDLQDVYQFYLDAKTRDALDAMGPLSRSLYLVGWMLRNSILKLPPARRVLLMTSVFLVLYGMITPWTALALSLAFTAVLLVLLLELMDKLLAQDELAAGRAVQAALLPQQPPELPGWEAWIFTRPANEVGGDLVDYLEPGPERLGLALGDVAGKGLGAALVMAKVQTMLRTLAPGAPSLAALAAQMNTAFRRDGLPGRFASLVYLEVDPGDGAVRLVNAGHLPPLVARRGVVEVLAKGGPALGLMPDAAYEEQHLNLDPDDVLLVYSDGATEARNDTGVFFETNRLQQWLLHLRDLPAADVGASLITEIDRFVGEARPNDDLSLVVLRYTGTGEDDISVPLLNEAVVTSIS